jgi:hypothetical protein
MKYLFLTISIIYGSFCFSQSSKYIYNIDNNSEINVGCKSSSSYKSIRVDIQNRANRSYDFEIPCGTYFENGRSNEQNLVVLFSETVYIEDGQKRSVEVTTACMNADKASPSSHSNWRIKNDKALGDLIRFYHENRSIVAIMTGDEFHSTRSKQADFLQMSVWAYFNADKKHILNFATKYMFEGDKEQAELFVDTTLPLIQIFTAYYKTLNK